MKFKATGTNMVRVISAVLIIIGIFFLIEGYGNFLGLAETWGLSQSLTALVPGITVMSAAGWLFLVIGLLFIAVSSLGGSKK